MGPVYCALYMNTRKLHEIIGKYTRSYKIHDLPYCDKEMEHKAVKKMGHFTVVSEKNGTFICLVIMERYIYLRYTKKQLKITSYERNKSFLEFYLVYNDVCLKLLGSLF